LATYSIKDIETLTGIKSHTIRIWEQRYGFSCPDRTDTNIRTYSDCDLKLLLNVSILNRNGYKISKIALMNEAEIHEKVKELNKCCDDIQVRIQNLIAATFAFDEKMFDKILTKNIQHMGLKKAMIVLILPFLKQIGLLWQTDSINPAYQHFITNIVRQKLIVAIDGQATTPLAKAKKFLLFLPEGESHEIGLLFANYLIRSNGHQSIYLGQNLRYVEMAEVFEKLCPDFIFSALTSGLSTCNVQQFINSVASTFSGCKIILSGYKIANAEFACPGNVCVVNCIGEMEQFFHQEA
jgi:DNA-binding transcriptional MerR regulator/predicted nucleic acid-binding Zn finger protein